MKEIAIFNITIPVFIYAPVIYFLWVSILLLVKKIVFTSIEKFASRTKSQLDDILLGALNFPLTLLIFVSGIFILERISPVLSESELSKYALIALKTTTIVAIVIFMDRLIGNLIQVYSSKIDILRTSGSVARGFVRIIVIALGLLILLDSFGVSITPLLASLGIGSLAIALALQPTLENFFAGIQIVIDKPIKVGQLMILV